jgi:hypothetical protein
MIKSFKKLFEDESVKLSINESGTMMNKYAPLFKTEYTFPVGIKMELVVAALHNASLR